jgi:hypothetical protein
VAGRGKGKGIGVLPPNLKHRGPRRKWQFGEKNISMKNSFIEYF